MFDIQQKLKNIKNIEICSLMIGLIGTDRENIEVNEIKQHRKDEVIRLLKCSV